MWSLVDRCGHWCGHWWIGTWVFLHVNCAFSSGHLVIFGLISPVQCMPSPTQNLIDGCRLLQSAFCHHLPKMKTKGKGWFITSSVAKLRRWEIDYGFKWHDTVSASRPRNKSDTMSSDIRLIRSVANLSLNSPLCDIIYVPDAFSLLFFPKNCVRQTHGRTHLLKEMQERT